MQIYLLFFVITVLRFVAVYSGRFIWLHSNTEILKVYLVQIQMTTGLVYPTFIQMDGTFFRWIECRPYGFHEISKDRTNKLASFMLDPSY